MPLGRIPKLGKAITPWFENTSRAPLGDHSGPSRPCPQRDSSHTTRGSLPSAFITITSPANPVKCDGTLVTNAIWRPFGDHAKSRASHVAPQPRMRWAAPPTAIV